MMTPIAFVVAGQGATIARVWLWVGILLGAIFIFIAAIYVVRWIALSRDTKRNAGFTIDQIDRLHDEGALTEEEYRRARRTALGLTDPDTPEKKKSVSRCR